MAYATYDYYTNAFGGSKIPEPLFPRCVNLATKYIDQFTFGRIVEPEEISNLKDCCCDMAETIYQVRFSGSGKEKKKYRTIQTMSLYKGNMFYVTEGVTPLFL